MFQKWELSHFPCEKDKNRWRLRIKISDSELEDLVKEINAETGRPFTSVSGDFNWGVYLYNISDSVRNEIVKLLKQKCHNGKVLTSSVEVDYELPPVLEEVLSEGLETLTEKKETAAKANPEKSDTEKKKHKKEKQKPAPEKEPAKESAKGSTKESKIIPELGLNTGYTFEEFIVGPNNRFTHAAGLAVSANPGKVYNPLFIYGGVGLGKTHLMQAIGWHVKKKNPDAKMFYITSEKFVSEVIEALTYGRMQQLRDKYRDIDLLLVDDIQFLAESESTQEEFFHTFNALHQSSKQIVLTSDRPPKMLTTLADRLKSRFEWGLITDIKAPSLETRVAILKKKGEQENLNLDEDILRYIGSKLKSNIRELEGFLKRINAYASIIGQPVNMQLAKDLMKELLPEEETAAETPAQAPVQPTVQPVQPPVQLAQPPVQPAQPTVQPVQPPAASPPPIQFSKVVIPSQTKQPSSVDASLKPVELAFFYPETKEQELIKVKEKFRNIIKKHNLKFRLESVFDRAYDYQSKINFSMFVELCKTNKINIVVVIGPPLDTDVTGEEFMNTLAVLMDNEKISMQYVPWLDLDKDYRYLNLALDIALNKH
jgi:chromosomal replication initiator protein DnaA